MAEVIPLKIDAGTVQQFAPTDTIPAGNLPASAAGDVSNVISSPDSVAADKSRVIVGYLELAAAFTVAGNVEIL